MPVQAQLLVKLDEDIKKKVSKLARQEGKTTSTVVRELIEEYIRERDIASYIDGLWDRIGGKIRSKGVRAEDIPRIIRDVRAKKA
jgi:predicted DNA-binding protein